ncbi:hypothetical protein, partial [Aureimonas sp. D3]|uniref:hypothetical protein n=1 Tax=Aureimonas sp. D3 TaxID=1638164 RepID=UPI001AEBD6F9
FERSQLGGDDDVVGMFADVAKTLFIPDHREDTKPSLRPYSLLAPYRPPKLARRSNGNGLVGTA